MALMISVSGIRGIFGTDLNPENLARFTAAYGTWAGGGTIVVGRDSRVTGELCERVVTAALQSVGCRVISSRHSTHTHCCQWAFSGIMRPGVL